MNLSNAWIDTVGLDYVGLPLAVEFGKHPKVLGFDINTACRFAILRVFDTAKAVQLNARGELAVTAVSQTNLD